MHILKLLLLISAAVLFAGASKSQTVSTLVQGPSTFDDCLTLDRAGNIYASRYVGSTVTKITPSGNTSIFASGFFQPNGTAFDAQGNLYVPNNISAGWIAKVSPQGTVDTILTGIGYPTAILFENDTTMLVSSYQSNRIYRAYLNGSFSILYTGNGMNGPVGMAFDDNGQLLIANYTDGKIFCVNSAGTFSLVADIPGIVGFIAVANHYIYATGFSANKIYRISMSGETSVLAGSGGAGQSNGPALTATFNAPNGIAVTATGDTIYISDFNSRSLRMITNVSVGIEQTGTLTPQLLELKQNFPNPFNPSTIFEFSVPGRGHVSLKIFDTMGREVQSIVSDVLSPGSYKAGFTAQGISSGTYFAVLTHGGIRQTRRISLIK
ncbi:MAG: T9SS type A sorting domain-containing protein [Ignavibacteria bacterium]|nr:T9SS type A sorting domain-containing protein [Ignavibacteria bacterium]